jgi:hypothetical protein
VLKPLAAALESWAPNAFRSVPSSGEQALGAVLAIWPRIAGEDVAAHATPIELSGDALLVLVTSSAWSNQLSLLSGHIVGALHDAGITGVERLRFRIGRARKGSAQRTIRGNGAKAFAAAERREPAATLDEAFARFRERLERFREYHRRRGWNQCRACSAMVPEGDRCAACKTAEASARSARVQRLMFDVPWLGFEGTAELVEGLTREEYESNRDALLSRWWEALRRAGKMGRLSQGGHERNIASSYLLMKTRWAPDRITPAIARNELGDEIYSLIYGHHQD